MSRSLLFLSYLFPPRGGAGVQRALKYAKYLPEFGWRPLIVAGSAEGRDNVTGVRDMTLLKDVPEEAVVRYTKAEGRSSLAHEWLDADPMGWWVGPAVEAGMELVREHDPAVIVVTMSPFTAAEAGIQLQQMTGLPLVLDLRDPWALDETKIYPSRLHAWRDRRAMGRALAAADLVVMNTPEAAKAVKAEFEVQPERVISITNGFDEEDVHSQTRVEIEPAAGDVLRIVHTGMFHTDMAPLWDKLLARRGMVNHVKHPVRPINLWTRTPKYLLEAMRRSQIPDRKVELVLVGEMSAADESMIRTSAACNQVRMLGYRPHAQSVAWVKSADVLFLPLHTPLDGGPALVVPGKTYEYLGSGRAVLAMGPPGDMRRFVRETGCGMSVAGDDVDAAAGALQRLYWAKLAGRRLCEPDVTAIARFTRREVARQMAEALDEAVACAETHPTSVR